MKANVKELIDQIKNLSQDDYDLVLEALLTGGIHSDEDINAYVSSLKSANVYKCPYCGGIHIVRNGHRKDGVQKFVCKDCKRSFVPMTNTVYAYSHKDLSTWESYIKSILAGEHLRAVAEKCKINLRTSFLWRHKIISSLCSMEDDVVLQGIVEGDGTFFNLSYKGNSEVFSNGEVQRMQHKRGGEIHKRGLSKEHVCVPCAVDRNHHSVAKVASLGACSTKELENVLSGKIEDNTIMCTDENSIYRKFALANNLMLIQIKGGKKVKGLYHIQHLNSFHSMLKEFIAPFHGVATKYLNGYLAWNNFVNYAREGFNEKFNILKEWLVKCNHYYPERVFKCMPLVPIPC